MIAEISMPTPVDTEPLLWYNLSREHACIFQERACCISFTGTIYLAVML